MSNTNLPSPADIDLGKHRIPESVKKQAALLEKINNHSSPKQNKEPHSEELFIPQEDITPPSSFSTQYKKESSTLPISKYAQDFICNNPKESEALLEWYANLTQGRVRSKPIVLGIPGFPFKVKINPLKIREEDGYLHVFVRADSALDISLPVASEVILDYTIDTKEVKAAQSMFLGELSFDKNFLFKILIFVVK